MTSESIFHKGVFYQTGDIVSMIDVDGGVYYAQLRGFLQDQYCEKSAAITWLLPSKESPPDRFDPSTYFLGPEEDLPRKLDCMQFVCHSTSEYFKSRYSPYPTLPVKPERGFIWASHGIKISDRPLQDEVLFESPPEDAEKIESE